MKTLQKIVNEIEIWEGWQNNYKDYVPLFIKEALTGKHWTEWDNEVFIEFFDKSSDQCVSSLKQGYFTSEEKDRIKENWMEIAPILKNIAASQDEAIFENYHELKKNIRKYTNQNRKAATNRLIAGLQPNLLCTIVNEDITISFIKLLNKNVENCNIEITWDWFKNSNAVWKFYLDNLVSNSSYDNITLPWQTYELFINERNKTNEMSEISENKSDNIELLKYKRQIILQGPPGTGKTREAKEICRQMISITNELIISKIKIGKQIPTAKGQVYYKILSIDDDKMILKREKGTTNIVTFSSIIDAYKTEKWKNDVTKNDDRMAVAIAKYLYDDFFKDNEQLKIIQFHPSYTYEDFVRGIVAESKGERIEYKNVNKTLGLFAEEALKNYQKSTKSDSKLSKNEWINEQFDNFVETVQSKIDDNGEYRLTDKVKLFDIDESAFYYTGDSWFDSAKHRMKFSDIKEAFLNDPEDKRAFKALPNISGSAKQHYGYYYKVFSDFKNSITTKFEEAEISVINPKNYVLIIDEINRANLSSVLGELIYALEYRGEEVESMYSVDDSMLKNKLILPPNLYIIGTMNTADRSVGHIDYAIRRRFAFVEVPPKDLSDDATITFDSDLFAAVKALFTVDDYKTRSTFLSKEFEPKDVALGHSYFIDKSNEGGTMAIRLEYEIKPILLEYVKDGVLVGETILEEIAKLSASI